MKRVVLLATAIVFACVPAASAGGEASTKVTIDAVFLGAGDTQWAGDIFSSRKVCKDERRVLIFLARSGADEKIGSTRSYEGSAQPGYFWTYSEPGAAKRGQYYASVKATDQCDRDRSTTLQGP